MNDTTSDSPLKTSSLTLRYYIPTIKKLLLNKPLIQLFTEYINVRNDIYPLY